jgi:hypothetical protein
MTEHRDKKYQELQTTYWLELDKVINIMDSKKMINLPCKNLKKTIEDYIFDWKRYNWNLDGEWVYKFKMILSRYYNRQISEPEFINIKRDIRQNQRKSEFYPLFEQFLHKTFMSKSYTDWYMEAALFFKKNYRNIEKEIEIKMTSENYTFDKTRGQQSDNWEKSKSPKVRNNQDNIQRNVRNNQGYRPQRNVRPQRNNQGNRPQRNVRNNQNNRPQRNNTFLNRNVRN